MKTGRFKLRYLPLFEQDLLQSVDYISHVLNNPQAAEKLIDDVEAAIVKRLVVTSWRGVFRLEPNAHKRLC